MFVQWAIKGIYGGTPPSGIHDDDARAIIDGGFGIICNWWRRVGVIAPPQCIQKLTHRNLAMHVNQYQAVDPQTGRLFSEDTPFISLAAGAVERDVFFQTNRIYPAKLTALDFATQGGRHEGYLFYCWVIVGLRPAVGIAGIAEEVRELNTYRSYSAYQTEGEITAKIQIPSNQIRRCERYTVSGSGSITYTPVWIHDNPQFVDPITVSNIRELF